jgi:hypothetical protein
MAGNVERGGIIPIVTRAAAGVVPVHRARRPIAMQVSVDRDGACADPGSDQFQLHML